MTYALRTIRKSPAFSLTVILILGLAIGGNTAMFTVVRAVLLKPLEFDDPERLVKITGGANPLWFEEIRQDARSFRGVGAFTGQENLSLVGPSGPEVLAGARVTANFLQILGVHPLLGRAFLPEEDSPAGAPAAMISAGLWRRRFGADPRTAGSKVTLGAAAYTIVGVLPAGFAFPFPELDVWLTAPSEWPLMTPKSRELSPFLSIFGRLAPAASLEQANLELAVLHGRYAQAHPAMLDAKPKSQPRVVRWKEDLVGKIRSILWMLTGAVGLVLLIACANLAGLLLARAASRSREFAVRSALGAAPGRLIRLLLAECILLAAAGGGFGVFLAYWILRLAPVIASLNLPRAGEIHLDGTMLGFAAALSLATGVLFGLLPAASASRPDLIAVLKAAGGTGRPGRMAGLASPRDLLVMGQVALSVVLLIGAALLMQSVVLLQGQDLGFNPANLLTTRISLPLSQYSNDGARAKFFQDLLPRVRSAPGVKSAAAAMFLPMTGFVGSPVQDAAKPALRLNERPIATLLIVSDRYFETLGIPLRQGRDFTPRDSERAQKVAIIDEACARHLWPSYPSGLGPVGQRLLIGGLDPRPVEVIGIAAAVHQNLENTSWADMVYVPFAQSPQSFAMLAIRAEGEPLALTGQVREQVRTMDRTLPIADVRTMEELIGRELGQRRLILGLLVSFAGVALLLTLVGIYSATAYSVARRTREVGIRRALGANRGDILCLVVGQAFFQTSAGVAAGLGGAWALTRFLQHLLFHVSPTQPAAFFGTAALFLAVTLAASLIPGFRATRVDPATSLRHE